MLITAPVSDLREIDPLAQSGADEFYCSYNPPEWSERFGSFVPFSRHSISLGNFTDLRRLKGAADRAHELGRPIYFTLNENYTDTEFPWILEALEKLIPIGFDAYIVGDLSVMTWLRESHPDVKMHVSSLSPNFNRQSIGFFSDFGSVTRVILPRDLKIVEMARTVEKANGMEIEAFAFYDRCFWVDGYCGFNHGFKELTGSAPQRAAIGMMKRPAFQKLMQIAPAPLMDKAKTKFKQEEFACCMKYEYEDVQNGRPANGGGGFEEKDPLADYVKNFDGAMCGMCEIRRMIGLGVHSLKVVGRAKPTHEKVAGVKMLRRAVELALSPADDQRYVEGCKAVFREGFGKACTTSNCYYND